jgi:hypothetical protein
MIINHAVIYKCKRNLAIVYVGRPGDTWVAEDVEIGFPPAGDTGRLDAPCS